MFTKWTEENCDSREGGGGGGGGGGLERERETPTHTPTTFPKKWSCPALFAYKFSDPPEHTSKWQVYYKLNTNQTLGHKTFSAALNCSSPTQAEFPVKDWPC